jgi:hypothetical protein
MFNGGVGCLEAARQWRPGHEPVDDGFGRKPFLGDGRPLDAAALAALAAAAGPGTAVRAAEGRAWLVPGELGVELQAAGGGWAAAAAGSVVAAAAEAVGAQADGPVGAAEAGGAADHPPQAGVVPAWAVESDGRRPASAGCGRSRCQQQQQQPRLRPASAGPRPVSSAPQPRGCVGGRPGMGLSEARREAETRASDLAAVRGLL